MISSLLQNEAKSICSFSFFVISVRKEKIKLSWVYFLSLLYVGFAATQTERWILSNETATLEHGAVIWIVSSVNMRSALTFYELALEKQNKTKEIPGALLQHNKWKSKSCSWLRLTKKVWNFFFLFLCCLWNRAWKKSLRSKGFICHYQALWNVCVV